MGQGYDVAPWIFKGRALYQLQLVKSEEARKYIPDNFKLVELFGYTLGGFYLARYDDSPCGVFDELVAMAGLVWNAPTSCAWAARVFVNHKEAREHGIKHVGLPSRLGVFKEQMPTSTSKDMQTSSTQGSQKQKRSWWRQQRHIQGEDIVLPEGSYPLEISNVDPKAKASWWTPLPMPICTLHLPTARAPHEFAGPRVRLALPSFSGATPDCPELLKYACDLLTNVRIVSPVRVTVPRPIGAAGVEGAKDNGSLEELSAVLGGKPLIAIAFDDMEMSVQEPQRLLLAQPSKDTAAGREL